MHRDITVAVGGPINADYPKTYKTTFLKPTIPFALQVTEPNTKYVIRHYYDLGGESFTVPENCILDFDGGSLGNGTLIGEGTQIVAPKTTIFSGITIDGTWNVPEITSVWFSDAESDNGLKNVFALQDAGVFNRIVVEDGNYSVSVSQSEETVLSLKSNLDLVINGTITLQPNAFGAYFILHIFDEKNVTISGSGTIIGDKTTHTGTEGQWGHCIMVQGCFVTIKDITVKDSWGDCIYIGKAPSQDIEIKNVIVDNCYLDNGRRQGVTVSHGNNIVISNCRITNIGGQNPQAAIDIEPNDADDPTDVANSAQNIVVENCRVENCVLGIVIYGRNNYQKSCISIDNCYIQCRRRAISVNGVNTSISVTNCEIHTRFHVVDANTIDGSLDNLMLFENNMIYQQPEEGDDMSTDSRGCVIYAAKGNYKFHHNFIQGVLPVFRFASGKKYIEDNEIVCTTLFYNYRANGVVISGNDITGNVTIPGTSTILENNTINGLLKSTEVAHDNKSIIRGNTITHPTENNEAAQFIDALTIEGNRFTNVKLSSAGGVVVNNSFVYDSNFTLSGQLVNIGNGEFSGNTLEYNGTRQEDDKIYIVRANIITNNKISAGSNIQYVFYPGSGAYIAGNILSLAEEQPHDHIVQNSAGNFVLPFYKNIGNSEQRPSLEPAEDFYIGCRYYDTELDKPIFWNGVKWIESDGATAGVLRKGTSANRPSAADIYASFIYDDTTLGKPIMWNGEKWIESEGATAGVLRKGTSANRPSADDIYINFIYFDTTLEKPILWSGNQWVDAVGAAVTVRIQYYLTNVSASNEEQPEAGAQFTTVLTADEGYSLPATIRIDMNNETLTAGTDYTYDQSTGEVVVLGVGGTGGVTGRKLQIVATGVEQE